MQNLKLTNHAKTRGQQRSISPLEMCILQTFGIEEEACGGCYKIHIAKKDLPIIQKQMDTLAKNLKRLNNIYLIEGADGSIVTAAHKKVH